MSKCKKEDFAVNCEIYTKRYDKSCIKQQNNKKYIDFEQIKDYYLNTNKKYTSTF